MASKLLVFTCFVAISAMLCEAFQSAEDSASLWEKTIKIGNSKRQQHNNQESQEHNSQETRQQLQHGHHQSHHQSGEMSSSSFSRQNQRGLNQEQQQSNPYNSRRFLYTRRMMDEQDLSAGFNSQEMQKVVKMYHPDTNPETAGNGRVKFNQQRPRGQHHHQHQDNVSSEDAVVNKIYKNNNDN